MKAPHAILPFPRVMDAHERLCLIGLSYVDFLKPHEKFKLIAKLGRASGIFELSFDELCRYLGRRCATRRWVPDQILRAAEDAESHLTEGGVRSIFYWDSTYPPLLREIFDPPVTLFYRGTLPVHGVPLAGIVGTRYPTGAARQAAYRLGFDLGREGIGVVSGLARGIDTDAHEGCVEAGGRSIAVLGNGIDEVYPVSSRACGRLILERGGAIVSEYPPGVPPLSYHFPARNRIISGLSRTVVVVQAPERSGALITAEHALDQGRDLWVHAVGITGSAGSGTARLADSGAPLLHGAADILRDWGMEAHPGHVEAGTLETVGERIARIMRNEIEGACALRCGETYWRR